MTLVAAGLGSNLGDRLQSLRSAVAHLRASNGIDVVAASGVYETDPVGPAQPLFLNAVVLLETELAPQELLAVFKRIEKDLGRVERERFGPREIDIDLLVHGDVQLSSDDLEVPHPRLAERAFVLVPLAEVAPELEVPGAGRVADLLTRADRGGVRPLAGGEGLLD